jgi:hypothetical protein
VAKGRAQEFFSIMKIGSKKNISKLINFILFFIPSQLNCPQNEGVRHPPRSSLFEPSFVPLLIAAACFWLVVV